MLLSLTLHLIIYRCDFNSYCHSVMWQSLKQCWFWDVSVATWVCFECCWMLFVKLLWEWHDNSFIQQLLFHHWTMKNPVLSCGQNLSVLALAFERVLLSCRANICFHEDRAAFCGSAFWFFFLFFFKFVLYFSVLGFFLWLESPDRNFLRFYTNKISFAFIPLPV